MLIEAIDRSVVPARLKVIGIGGCGGNAVGRMIQEGLHGLEFVVVNTDLQALHASPCPHKLQIGAVETRGLGTGGDPTRGRKAAEEDEKILEDHILGVDMLFITAGMGGGTGTGGAPMVARIARSLDILTVAVVTSPFHIEGRPRRRIAEEGIEELRREVDTLIVVPNEKLLEILDPKTPLPEAYRAADEVLYQATRGISELITIPGVMNRDFADVRSVMKRKGNALMGIGVATGENRARAAAMLAISNRLLEDVSIQGAEAVLVNVAGGEQLGLGELSEAVTLIQEAAGEDAHIYLGNVIDASIGDEVRVTVVATGFGTGSRPEPGKGRPEVKVLKGDMTEDGTPLATHEEREIVRSWGRNGDPPARVRPTPQPLWGPAEITAKAVGDESSVPDPVTPLPLTPAGAGPTPVTARSDWSRGGRRRAMDLPAFRRRPAR